MSIGVEALFTSALGLKWPWEVVKVDLDTVKRRIDFEVACNAKQLPCPACGVSGQGIHDRVRRDWRHLDFFQHEAWLHADVPRVDCAACGKTTTVAVPWANPSSGFTLLFEAFALSLCQSMPVAHAASLLRVDSRQLWRRIEHYVDVARAQYEARKHTDLIIDVVPGRGGMFSLDNGREQRFLTRSKLCALPAETQC